MKIYKKGQGNRARAIAALAAVAIAVFGIAEVYSSEGTAMIFVVVSAFMVVVVAGGGIYLSLINARTSEFLIETQAELKKVAWPPKDEVKGSSAVVVGTVVVMGVFLVIVDYALAFITRLIQVYPSAS